MFRNFIWNTIGSTLASFNSLIFLVIITRMNGLEDSGVFSICVAIASILYVFAVYSGRSCQVTDIKNEIKDKDYIISRIITCIGMIIITIGFIIINQYDSYKNTILLYLCIWKCIEAFVDVLYGILQKNNRLDQVGKSLVIKSVVASILFFIIMYFTHNLKLATSVLILTSILVLVLYDIPNSMKHIKKGESIQKQNIKKIYKGEFFLFASAFLTMYLLNAPKYAIESYLSDEIQGIYGIVLMPASIIPLFSQFITAPVVNELTQYYRKKEYNQIKKFEKKLSLFVFGFGAFAVMIAYFIGIPVLNWIYNVDLSQYKISLIFIIMSYTLYAAGAIQITILTMYRKIKSQFYIYIATSVCAFLLSNTWIRIWGESGIIPTYIITMLFFYIIFVLITQYQTHKNIKESEK